VLRSSQRPSDSATTCLPFWTMALFPSISRRYSPAFNSDLPSFAVCEMLMVFVKGFANAGTASAIAASRGQASDKRIRFHCASISFQTGWSQPRRAVVGWKELTRMRRTSTLAREDTNSSWANGRKRLRVMTPRLPPRGFSDSRQKQPRSRLHPYRRTTGGECFVITFVKSCPSSKQQESTALTACLCSCMQSLSGLKFS